MENYKKTLIDVSQLESPEPLKLILDHAREITEEEIIIVTHRLNPMGLYPFLTKLELQFSTKQIKPGEFEIRIWK